MNDKTHLTVPNFEPANATQNELCVELGNNDYSYALVDVKNQTVKVISAAQTTIFNDIEGNLLQTHFAKTKISLTTKKFTFIPTEVYHEKDLEVYSKYLNLSENEAVFVKSLEKSGITVIFAFEKHLLDKIEKYFPEAAIYPQFIPFFTGVEYAFSQISYPQLFANFKSDVIEIIIFNQHKFQFYNAFEYTNEDELLYFMLLATQQNKLKPAQVMVKVSGNIDTNGAVFQKIKAQFNHTEVTDLDSLPLTYLGLNEAVMPRFFSLLSLHLCE
ncbi:DUF3822 family protein [Pedobacter cryophilus]|uniref:DUF3822 family protein n=1 Tax=Pedobacter cryophilus TaxID=2571271 RepID=A0A4U1C4Y8_9SPHI|nr:DUF3822 family protein [Pedobacter cryophilus]TKB99239.1 DUF3822 family protein [Pedobacter cryophilus]